MLPLVGGQPTRNLGVQLTLSQPGGADYAHYITASPSEFENPAASLPLAYQKLHGQNGPSHILQVNKNLGF